MRGPTGEPVRTTALIFTMDKLGSGAAIVDGVVGGERAGVGGHVVLTAAHAASLVAVAEEAVRAPVALRQYCANAGSRRLPADK